MELVDLEPVENAGVHGLDEIARLELRLLEPVTAHEPCALQDRVVELAAIHDIRARRATSVPGGEPLAAQDRIARARDRDDHVARRGVAMALARLRADLVAEGRELLRRSAVGDHALDGGDSGANACNLRLGLVAAPDHSERARVGPREMARGDAGRRAGSELSQAIGFDHGDELGALRVEEADHERRAARCRRIELPAGEAEPAVGGGHVRKRALRQAKPAARRDLDLSRGHPQEARFDCSDRSAGLDEPVDIGFAEIERHEPQV